MILLIAVSPLAAVVAVFLKCKMLAETVLDEYFVDWHLSKWLLFIGFINQLAALDEADTIEVAKVALFGQGDMNAFGIMKQLGTATDVREAAFKANDLAKKNFEILLLAKFQQTHGVIRGIGLYASLDANDWHRAHLQFDEERCVEGDAAGEAGNNANVEMTPAESTPADSKKDDGVLRL